MASVIRQLFYPTYPTSEARLSSIPPVSRSLSTCCGDQNRFSRRLAEGPSRRNLAAVARSSQESDGIVAGNDDEEGVSLGTMKLPLDIDLQRFDSLLFQWANSLCQGANLPLPVPLKVDKIQGGARLGFITIGDGKTEVFVYIDCVVSPATAGSGPIFRAIRNGPLKEQSPPGEPRIMRSLLEALKKSVEISRV